MRVIALSLSPRYQLLSTATCTQKFYYRETQVVCIKYTLPLTRIELTALVGVIRVRFIVLNATFNNISAISWWSVLMVEETGVPRENNRSATSH
jgi:hypothetical protein